MSRQVWLNIPNMITVARILSVPVMVWLILIHRLDWAFWVFLAAGISDGLDGYLAKVLKNHTTLGAYLDPIADKIMLVSTFIVLGVQELIPLWLVIMVVSRDLAIVLGAGLIEILTHNLKMSPNFSSKVNTTVQIILVTSVLGVNGLGVSGAEGYLLMLVYAAAVTTLLSGAIYLYQWGIAVSQANGDE